VEIIGGLDSEVLVGDVEIIEIDDEIDDEVDDEIRDDEFDGDHHTVLACVPVS